jgi:hypothetical protein
MIVYNVCNSITQTVTAYCIHLKWSMRRAYCVSNYCRLTFVYPLYYYNLARCVNFKIKICFPFYLRKGGIQ